MIAVDEIHRANNKNSGTGKHLLKLQAEYMVAATGSLITNSPTSAYLPLA
jgi:SNF2 family DNA or RNA helicase